MKSLGMNEESEVSATNISDNKDSGGVKRKFEPLSIGEEEIAKKIYLDPKQFAFKRGSRIVFIGASQSGNGLIIFKLLYSFDLSVHSRLVFTFTLFPSLMTAFLCR